MYEDALKRISIIQVRESIVFISFDDGYFCELDMNDSSQPCSRRLSCYGNDGNGCRIYTKDSLRILDLVLSKGTLEYGVSIVPDWVSKITKSGEGWEVRI